MFELDLHTHTIASGHAYSTVIENAKAAREKGIKLLGVTDHTPGMPGSTHIFYFRNLKVLPEIIEGVRILKGAEANIIDYQGDIDMTEEDWMGLDYLVASLHIPCLRPSNKKENTRAVIGAIKHPKVAIIGHPDDDRYDKDYSEIVKAAKYYNKLIEINDASLNPKGFRNNAEEQVLRYLEICAREQVKVICNSDAHFAYDIGKLDRCQKVLEKSGFPKDLVVNHNSEEMLAYIRDMG